MKSNPALQAKLRAAVLASIGHVTMLGTTHPFNSPLNHAPPLPTPGSNRKAAKRRSGIQYRHGKAGRN